MTPLPIFARTNVKTLIIGIILAHSAIAAEPPAQSEPSPPSEIKPPPIKPSESNDSEDKSKWATAVEPKPLSDTVLKGLKWLVSKQLPDGGWGQGEESSNMGKAQQKLVDVSNVADTCTACLTLIRAGSTPTKGPHAKPLLKGIEYVCGQIEASDSTSLYVTDNRGTRLQAKLGTYIDTFMATMLLSEVKDKMPNDSANKRVGDALSKTIDKIEKNQKDDGTWANAGWAPTLAQAMASKAINRAVQNGVEMEEDVRQRAERQARARFDEKNRSFDASGSANVALYALASSVGGMQDSDNSNEMMADALKQQAKDETDPAKRNAAEARLTQISENRRELAQAKRAMVGRLGDKGFVAGFGSNGGEEFLSYMTLGESLVVDGGEAWTKWDREMTANLNRIQNPDGSWTGHHCITGRTFCTSAALLVLTVDRAPVPLAVKIRKGS